jgi:hypothetical protein
VSLAIVQERLHWFRPASQAGFVSLETFEKYLTSGYNKLFKPECRFQV